MVRPHGLILRRPPGLAHAIGLPDPIGSRVVTEALELLASEGVTGTPGAEARAAPQAVPGPVLLVRPPSDARPFWDYLHYQLAHLSYPQRIDLVAAGGTASLAVESDAVQSHAVVGYSPGNYMAILAPPGVELGPGWEPRQRGTALILYGPARP
jgi:hypothetical protein